MDEKVLYSILYGIIFLIGQLIIIIILLNIFKIKRKNYELEEKINEILLKSPKQKED